MVWREVEIDDRDNKEVMGEVYTGSQVTLFKKGGTKVTAKVLDPDRAELTVTNTALNAGIARFDGGAIVTESIMLPYIKTEVITRKSIGYWGGYADTSQLRFLEWSEK